MTRPKPRNYFARFHDHRFALVLNGWAIRYDDEDFREALEDLMLLRQTGDLTEAEAEEIRKALWQFVGREQVEA